MTACRLPIVLSVFAAMCLCASAAAQEDGAAPVLYTTGPVADAPIQVGTWTPLDVDTPPWIFPMIYARWRVGRDTVEEFAPKIVEEIRSRPADQPIWIQINGWFGNYKPRDPGNVIAHEADATPAGTPGIWPEKGIEEWEARHRQFLEHLRNAGARLDAWPLDNETKVHRWARNYQGENVFLNMVRDPRWGTAPIKGVWLPGRRFVTRREIEQAENPDEAAHAWVRPLAIFMRDFVFDEHFAKPIYEFYPHAWVSDYGRYPNKSGGMYGDPDVVARIKQVAPYLDRKRGLGNSWAIVLYGGRDNTADRVELSLAQLDLLLRSGVDPQRVTPWLASPSFGLLSQNWETKEVTRHPENLRFTDEEWTRLVVECAQRGIRRFLIWNTELHRHEGPESEETMVRAFTKASEVARQRLERLGRQ